VRQHSGVVLSQPKDLNFGSPLETIVGWDCSRILVGCVQNDSRESGR
jgi:hypothetical protein